MEDGQFSIINGEIIRTFSHNFSVVLRSFKLNESSSFLLDSSQEPLTHKSYMALFKSASGSLYRIRRFWSLM